jgi:hypothetical protein
MPSVQLRLGLPFLLLLCGVHNHMYLFWKSFPSSHTAYPYHLNWLVLMFSTTIVVLTFIIFLILPFLIRFLLDLSADLHQKSISVVRNMVSDLFFSDHISQLYVTMLFMMVLCILFLLSFVF